METNIVDTTILKVRDLLEHNEVGDAIRLIESLLPPDQADVFEELPPHDQQSLLPQLETEDAADILEEMEDEDAAEVAGHIQPHTLAPILDEMAPDEAADLLGDLNPSLSAATLGHMHEPEEVRPLLLHPDETAGGLMTSEYLAFPQEMTASQVLSALRKWEPRGAEVSYFFVVDGQEHLVGVVNVFQVIRASASDPVSSLMDRAVIKAQVGDDQEHAAHLMAHYDLGAVPVVDEDNRLVGVITADDLVEVLRDEATEDIQRIGGSEPLHRPYSDTSIPSAAWKRLGWLLLLFVTGTLTSTVMGLFQDEHHFVTLALFVPLLIGTGGNAGTQATSTIIRAIAVGDVELKDSWRVLWREFRTAMLLGSLLAIAALVRSLTWPTSFPIAVVVGFTIFAIVVWANCVGAFLPLLAAKLHIDPALVSGPLMSTLVDATGLLIYFSIAGLVLHA